MAGICLFEKHEPHDFACSHCTPGSDFKGMWWDFMNGRGIFRIPVFVILAVYLPT
jgi:hypothetical protein